MVERFYADHYSFGERLRIARSDEGWSRAIWQKLADLGLLLLPVGERDFGLGGSGIELMIVGEAMGRALALEPYGPHVQAAALLNAIPDFAGRSELISGMTSGTIMAIPVLDGDLLLTAGTVSGRAAMVEGGGTADRLLVAVTEDGASSLVLIDAAHHGIKRDVYRLHGGATVADLVLTDVPVAAIIASGRDAKAAVERAQDVALALTLAQSLGTMQAAFDLTVDYLKTRIQFDKLLGANQALQHRAAEMLVELEQARSAAIYGAVSIDEANPDERRRALSAARIVAIKSARFIAQQAVQLHGGIGVTEEYLIGHALKRLTALSLRDEREGEHMERLENLGGFVSATPYWTAA